MAEKSIKKNFIYNLIYQMLLLVTPLFVTPYVSRVLGPDGVGLQSFATSIVSYFALVAVLGTTTFGQRAVSYAQSDPEGRSRAFWEMFILRLVTSLVTLGFYIGYCYLFVGGDQRVVYLILALNVLNVTVDVSWFLQGMEEFGKTAFTGIFFRLLNVACIFLFVKSPDDLPLYALFMILFTVLGNCAMWLYLPKRLCKVKGIKPFRDIKGVLQLFIPTIAVQVYTVLDKSMIGWFSDGLSENGYYEQAEKIVRIAQTAVTSLGIVMIPRISRTFKEGDMERVKYYLYKSYRYVWMLGVPLMLGIISVSSVFVPIYFGEGWEKCAILMPIFSILLVLIGLSNVTGLQYFVSTSRQNVLTLTVLIGAGVNLVFNFILIPFFSSVGASIASVIAELCVTLAGFIYVRKKKLYPIKPIFTCSWKYWIAGIVMFGVLFTVKFFVPVALWSLCALIAGGIVIYFVVLLLLRDSFLFEILQKGFALIKGIFVRKKLAAEPAETPLDEAHEEGEVAPDEPQDTDGESS